MKNAQHTGETPMAAMAYKKAHVESGMRLVGQIVNLQTNIYLLEQSQATSRLGLE